ncbi:hypothetical protein CCO03_04755 [Comamonas serinivorans]|uniref:Uncharacterized protein n=1 Tax=Comamonas serinivorans TaxID=1082851 RepID=A0A1Y0EKA8_9BURK|nr:hypothetical protein [Comamonas serinivorans]ARU04074.1 hypothetical protein CCO03_04755 [Comamonas serinivorans]
MPLRIDEAITQLDHGWLSHLKSQGYGGDALRQAIDLVLYAQQQAAARNSAEFKAAIARVNHLVGAGIACDNNGDYLYTAEWRDPACAGLGFAIEYAADPASWRAEFRMPGCWPHTVDNLDITDTRAVDHDFALWLARASARHFTHLIERQLPEGEALRAPCTAAVRAGTWAEFVCLHPLQPVARLGHERLEQAAWSAQYPSAAQRELQARFDVQSALLLRLIVVQQAAWAWHEEYGDNRDDDSTGRH